MKRNSGMRHPPAAEQSCVAIVAMDPDVVRRGQAVAAALGHAVVVFDSTDALLEAHALAKTGCAIICDALLQNNLVLLRDAMLRKGRCFTFLVTTAQQSLESVMQLVRTGVRCVLERPLDETLLARELQDAVAFSVQHRDVELRQLELRDRLKELTPREQNVLAYVKLGMTSREIAKRIGRSMKTIELHRSHIFRKLGARSVVELVRDIARVELNHGPIEAHQDDSNVPAV